MYLLRFLLLILIPATGLAQQSENVQLISNWFDTTNIPANSIGQRFNDVHGFVWNGKEYAALGSTRGVHIIDIDANTQICNYPGKEQGAYVTHRSYKTYKNYLYAACDQGFSTLQVFDLSHLPDSLHLVYESDPLILARAHTIFIDTAKATLYCASAMGLASGQDFLRVYSLADPENPVLLTKFNEYDKIHDMYVRNDTAYCSASYSGYYIVDFSNHGSYTVIGGLPFYPKQGFNHSSSINKYGLGVMIDETHGLPMKVIDTRNILDLKVKSNFTPRPNDSTCIAHNPYMVNFHAVISHYFDGLQIYDLRDPANPVRSGYYDTYPGTPYKGFGGAWGCYPYLPSERVLVSDMQTGLYVFNIQDALGIQDAAAKPRQLSVYPNPVTDHIYFSLPGQDKKIQVSIFDIGGRLVEERASIPHHTTNQPIQLTLPCELPAGTYTIRVTTEVNTYSGIFTKS